MKRVLGMLLLAAVVAGWTGVASADHSWSRDRDCHPNHRPTPHSTSYRYGGYHGDRYDDRVCRDRYDDRGCGDRYGHVPPHRPPVVTGYRGPVYRPSYYVAPPPPRGFNYNGRNLNFSFGY